MPSPTIDLSGQRFGRLTVLHRGEDVIRKNGRHSSTFVCQCDCGNVVQVRAACLKSGNTQSCYTNVRISDSVVTNRDYAKRAVELGHGILSSCEHSFQGRYQEVVNLAKEYGLKPLISAEAYWVKNRNEKDRTNCHIFIAAMNESGRRALNSVLSEANLTGFYGQPRLDIELLLWTSLV